MAWVVNDQQQSVIAIGKGIAFGKQKGDVITLDEIERVFTPAEDSNENSVLKRAMSEIPAEVLELTELVSDQAARGLGIPMFDNSHFLALADHLNYALKRSSEGSFDYPENLRWEVRELYPKEHDAAIDALYLIEKKTGVRLPKSEQTFLTYHFVNAQYDTGVNLQSTKLTEMISRSLEVIQYHYQMILDQNSVNYIRFVTHLRYFILRQNNQDNKQVGNVDPQLVEIVRKNYRKAYQAAEKVAMIVSQKTESEISGDEVFYLTLHIDRVTQRQ
ncbi:BglG family transcriptional antiterminator [Enterococcus canis]|uniref:BglG family transcriptional antiterminator n=1 Tax=Enterococcus canis TaxID=214095 RepID=A0A1L8RI91_9ENTE|nr:BglG family transcriptional antiterminator [Enterococcus canis]